MGVNEERIVEYVDRFYRNDIIEHLPVKDDNELLEEHKRAVERVLDAKKVQLMMDVLCTLYFSID